MIDPEKWPEVLSINVGDPRLAREIARRWNLYPELLAELKRLAERFKTGLLVTGAAGDEEIAEAAISKARAIIARAEER